MKRRNMALDAVRVFALLCVISVHYFLHCGFYSVTVEGKRMFLMILIRNFFMICVPLFMILTGYLMCSKELSKHYYSGIKKPISIYVLASILCILFKNKYLHENYGIKESILGILGFSAANYSWYIEMYIGLFLLIPFLNLIYKGLKDKKQKMILLGTLFFIVAIPGMTNIYNFYVDSWWSNPTLSSEYQKLLPNWWQSTLYPVLYYYIGCFLREFDLKISKKMSALLLGLCILVSGIFSYYRSYGIWFVSGGWNKYESLFVVIMTVLVFHIITHMKFWNNLPSLGNKMLVLLSNVSLGAYLVSYIFDSMIYPYLTEHIEGFVYKIEYFVIVVPIVFVCSVATSYLMNVIYASVLRVVSKCKDMTRKKTKKIL